MIKGSELYKKKFVIFLFIFLINFLIWFFLYRGSWSFFSSNDDTGMMKVLSGYVSGKTTSQHPYIGYFLGKILSKLYIWYPNISWYSIYSVFVMLFSVSIIYYEFVFIFARNKTNITYIILFSLFFISFVLFLFINISFTLNASLCGTAAIFFLFSIFDNYENKYVLIANILVECVLLFVAMQVRIASFMACIPIWILVLLYHIYKKVYGKIDTKYVLLMLFGCLVVFTFMYCVSKYTYLNSAKQNESEEYQEFSKWRGLFSDYSVVTFDEKPELYSEIGWSYELYILSRNWFYLDHRFNTENLKKIIEDSDIVISLSDVSKKVSIKDVLRNLYEGSKNHILWITEFIIFVCLFIYSSRLCVIDIKTHRFRIEHFIIAIIEFVAFAEIVYLCIRGRYIYRSFLCAMIPTILVGILSLIDCENTVSKSILLIKRNILVIIVIAFAIVSVYFNFDFEKRNSYINGNLINEEMDILCSRNQECFFIYDTSIVGDTRLFLNMENKAQDRQNRIFWGGTGVFNSTFYNIINSNGFEEFYSEQFFDDKVRFVTTISYEELMQSVFLEYLKKSYGENVCVSEVEYKDVDTIHVYKFMK